MARKYSDNMVHFEKRATNKVGLIFVLFLSIIGIGVGSFYLYKHRDTIDWNIKLPWDKEKTEEEENNKDSENKQPNKEAMNRKLDVPSMSEEVEKISDTEIKFYNLEGDEKGYTIKVDVKTYASSATLKVEKVLVDGFDTSATLDITDNYDQNGSSTQFPTTSYIRIPKTELDKLNIIGIRSIILYYKLETPEEKKDINRLELTLYSKIKYDNKIKGLIELYHNNGVLANYYQTLTDKDYTYIYFDFKNENHLQKKTIKIKKLVINDTIYEYKNFNTEIYNEAEKVFYLAIPKDKVKEVKNFTVSFFILDTEEKGFSSVYITPEYKKEWNS